MSRFFVEEKNIKEDIIYITDRDDVKHLSKVLRHRISDIIEISDNREFEYEIELTEISADEVCGTILTKRPFEREPYHRVTLYQGIPKQGKMELIIQKTVELGVDRIIPVFTERTVVQDKGNFSKKTERWQKIADEAVKQCRRGVIPSVEDAISFEDAAEHMKENDFNIFCYEDENKTTLKEILRDDSFNGYKNIGLIIGPEGGFSEKECSFITEAGAASASLGKTILRVETASVAAMAMLMYELEQ
ncbi:MAG: 16S rRNA (uracil(1498)-N(3))-methyltransferase [Firmicutes bacterium]|nr:16S rRNA (uracil(1498)-N(3))-methyltransferase [Bacillota bacterium]